VLGVAASLLGGTARGDEPAPETLAACLACHGEGGVSRTPEVPSLAAQPDLFIEWQLVYYRDGTRPGDIMVPVAQALSDADIRALGAYFAALPAPPPAADADRDPALGAEGARLAAGGRCANCHLPNFAGQGEIPRLAGQREEVLDRALNDYKTGTRRGRGNAAMPEIVYGMSADDIKALAHFLSLQPG
jgi:cytochrome c553